MKNPGEIPNIGAGPLAEWFQVFDCSAVFPGGRVTTRSLSESGSKASGARHGSLRMELVDSFRTDGKVHNALEG